MSSWLRRRSPVKRQQLRPVLEFVGLPFLKLALRLVRLYRPDFVPTSPHLYALADRLGIYPLVDHYHDPPVRPAARDDTVPRQFPWLDLRVEAQLDLLRRLRYGEELSAIPLDYDGVTEPYYRNGLFGPVDAQLLYSLLRMARPQLVMEVGSGESTRFATKALAVNAAEGDAGRLVAIEPYGPPYLESLGVEVVRRRAEEVDPSVFKDLAAGDVLFIDSSHVPQPGGDVPFLLLEVLPALAPGVLVHVHDVFTPYDYPAEWSRRRWFWTEQYVLEALLADNPRLEVLLAAAYLAREHPTDLAAACPVPESLSDIRTSSFWLRTCAVGA